MDVLELVWVVPIRVMAFVQRVVRDALRNTLHVNVYPPCACSGACIASTQGADETTSNSYSK